MFKRLFGKKKHIVVVSGLPRSGTSMMMKMLDAAGIAPVQDGIRSADTDNPKGYYEFERVKKLSSGDVAWLPDAEGKAVKIISALLVKLPEGYTYKVLFMRRDLNEVLASQAKMLERRGEDSSVDDEQMKAIYLRHIAQVETWMKSHPNLDYIDVDYSQLVTNPLTVLPQVNQLLGGKLDIQAMAQVADPTLYRNKG